MFSCSNCLHGISGMHGYFDEWMLHISLIALFLAPSEKSIFQTQFWGLFGQAYELYKQTGVEPGNEQEREDPGNVERYTTKIRGTPQLV